MDAAEPVAQTLRELLAATVTALESAGVPDEALGRMRAPRRFARKSPEAAGAAHRGLTRLT